jgi:hypothetical protein
MPGFLLNTGSVVICGHGGQAKPTAPMPRVRVMGQPVTTLGAPYAIAGCPNPPPPISTGPCVLGNWIVAATRVRAMGMPVLLQDSVGICVPTPVPLIVILAQPRVRGM